MKTGTALRGLVISASLLVPFAAAAEELAETEVDVDVKQDTSRAKTRVDVDEDETNTEETSTLETPSESLPRSKTDYDPKPPVAAPAAGRAGIVRQAGVGGDTAYGRAGVVELGGSASFTRAPGLTNFNFSPSIGWFFQDNMQLSTILGLNFGSVEGVGRTFMTALIEPSYHLPFNDSVFGFLGLGAGLSYSTPDVGFAIAPRVGANVLVGRSGILTPALFLNYSTRDVTSTSQGTLLQLNVIYGLQVGYTIML
jgi:hypothetical protein